MTILSASRSVTATIRLMPDPTAVNSMFARIARRYDFANRLLSGGMDVRWRKHLVEAVIKASPDAVIDLATGSGDVAFALSRRLPATAKIIGMDFCRPMLDEAEGKKAAAPSPAAPSRPSATAACIRSTCHSRISLCPTTT